MDFGEKYEKLLVRVAHFVLLCRKSFLNRPRIHEEPEYCDAFDYKNKYLPKDNKDYKWVREYARFTFDQLLAANNLLDSKADNLVKVFASGSGLLSLGAILQLPNVSATVACFWAISLASAVACIITASLVRHPKDAFLPPSIAFALAYEDTIDKGADVQFVAQWHVACEGMRLSNMRKNFGLKLASWLGMFAILVLSLSFIAAIATMDVTSPKLTRPKENMTDTAKPSPPAPDPKTQSQTPGYGGGAAPPQASGPQSINAGHNPVVAAGPQSIQDSKPRDK